MVCDYFSTLSSGGAERVAREVGERLAARSDVDVMLFTGVPRRWPSDPQPPGFPVQRKPAWDLTPLLGAQLALTVGSRRALRRMMRGFKPHVIHAQSLHFLSTVTAATLSSPAVPLVTTAHLGSVAELPARVRVPTQTYERTIGRLVLRRSSRVIAVSASVQEHVVALGARPQAVDLVPNGVDVALFDRPRDGDPDGPLRVAYTGRLIANKGPDVLLDAVASLHRRGVPLVVDIYGDGARRGAIEARIRREGLAEVRLHGHVSDLPIRLADTDVLVRPSYTEGLPLGVLEGMAAGCAVVATAVPGNTDLVEDGVNGLLVPPGDPDGLADALARLVEQRDLVDQMGREARRRAESYSWDSCAEATLGVLRRAVPATPT